MHLSIVLLFISLIQLNICLPLAVPSDLSDGVNVHMDTQSLARRQLGDKGRGTLAVDNGNKDTDLKNKSWINNLLGNSTLAFSFTRHILISWD